MDGNPSLTKNYIAEGAIGAYRICKHGSAEGLVAVNTTQECSFAGICDKLGGTDTHRVDIIKEGIAEVILGGTVAYGDELISDANGAAVAKAGGIGAAATVIGLAQEAGTAGAVIRVHLKGYKAVVAGEAIHEVTLTTEQLLALYTTPIEVLAAPGAGKAYVPVGCTAFMDYATTAYDGVAAGEDLVISYTDASGTALFKFETTGFLDQASDQVRHAMPSVYGDTNLTPVANAKLVAHLLTGNIATGDSPLKLRIAYRIIDTAW